MRLLFLTHAFNSLTQRLFVECARWGHEVSVEFDIHDSVTESAVALWRPDLVVAPYLRRAIPASVWTTVPCLVIHPGVVGDRGPSSLDWAILDGVETWGVTVLQANADMDAGDIWAHADFAMRPVRKSGLYRNEVTEAAVVALREALDRHAAGERPVPLADHPQRERGSWRPLLSQADRAIDWHADDTATVLRKIWSADGAPGLLDPTLGSGIYLFDAAQDHDHRGRPGELLARCAGAVSRATVDGAVWIGHLRRGRPADGGLKLPASDLLGATAQVLPEVDDDPFAADGPGAIRYTERGAVGYLHFAFYNGAMSSAQCVALRDAYARARQRPTRVLVLCGGPEFWSNGMHLNVIEAAPSAADASWENINAIDDLARDIIDTDDRLTVAALAGNAGAGGVFLALAADRVLLRDGVLLNPHYKSMGNLYGSEYWTYLLPRRVAADDVERLVGNRLPVGAREALALGLVDGLLPGAAEDYRDALLAACEALATEPGLDGRLAGKRRERAADEAHRPLADYRAAELERMHLNFYGFDPSYHVARYNFVFKVAHSRTPLWLARHRG